MNALLPQIRVYVYLLTVILFAVVMTRAELVDYSRWQNEFVQHFGNFKYRFLTTWNFITLSVHASLSLLCEYLLLKDYARTTRRLGWLLRTRDILFCSVVFPLSLLVFSVFWGLYWYDRELIFPHFMDEVLPPFDNHMVHSSIAPLVLLETVTHPRVVPQRHVLNLAVMTGFFLIYAIPFLGTYFVHGKFLYPFIQLMSPAVFVLFCGILWLYVVAIYMAQWALVDWRWGGQYKLKV